MAELYMVKNKNNQKSVVEDFKVLSNKINQT